MLETKNNEFSEKLIKISHLSSLPETLNPKLDDPMCIIYVWLLNRMLETQNNEFSVKLIKISHLSHLSESLNWTTYYV